MSRFAPAHSPFLAAACGALLLMVPVLAGAEAPVVTADPGAVAPRVVSATELWRAGGEDDEVFFGNVGAPCLDAEGNLYLLDSQLSQAHVFSPDGEFLRTVGREGDGPGEVRRPNDMFLTADGVVSMLQGFPGSVVQMQLDGTPVGRKSYSAEEGAAGQFAVLNRGLGLPDGMVLAGIRMTMGNSPVSTQTFFLDVCDAEGVRRKNLLEKVYTIDYSDFALDEQSMDFVWTRLAGAPDGRIFAAPERAAYEVHVFAPDGTPERIIRCAHETPARDDRDRKIAHQIIEAIGAYYPVPPRRITIEDTAPAVAGLWATGDGRLWVQSNRSELDAPAGAWMVLDVFAPDGSLEGRLGVAGDHDPREDAVMILDGNRMLVVKGALSAFLNQQAVAQDEEAEEADPLEVICYRLEI